MEEKGGTSALKVKRKNNQTSTLLTMCSLVISPKKVKCVFTTRKK